MNSADEYKPGDKIEARWKSTPRWYPGVIMKVHTRYTATLPCLHLPTAGSTLHDLRLTTRWSPRCYWCRRARTTDLWCFTMTVTQSTTSEENSSGINVSYVTARVSNALPLCGAEPFVLNRLPSLLGPTSHIPHLIVAVSKRETSRTNVTGESCLGCAASSLFL